MGIGWLQNILSPQTNIFWKSLLNSWIHLLQNVTPETNNIVSYGAIQTQMIMIYTWQNGTS